MAKVSNYWSHHLTSGISCIQPWIEYLMMILLTILYSLWKVPTEYMHLITLIWFLAEYSVTEQIDLFSTILESSRMMNIHLNPLRLDYMKFWMPITPTDCNKDNKKNKLKIQISSFDTTNLQINIKCLVYSLLYRCPHYILKWNNCNVVVKRIIS